ncbi:MAG: hypothetical protein K9K67_03390 [Bacteriovoracaceae bacterium]|nr:hypothetical protein [Bacteriovoracaceae bacterium]
MKTLLLILVSCLINIGHTYAEELEKMPHESALFTEYQKLMNGETPIIADLPTDQYALENIDSRILNDERYPGKVSRSPAIAPESKSDIGMATPK